MIVDILYKFISPTQIFRTNEGMAYLNISGVSLLTEETSMYSFFAVYILLPLLLMFIGYLAGILATKVNYIMNIRNPSKRFWSFKNNKISILTSCYEKASCKTEFQEIGFKADMFASAKVADILDSLYKTTCTVDIFASDSSHTLADNLVVIGGPVHCELSRRILNERRVHFHYDEYTLIDETSGIEYQAIIDEKNYVSEDYALIINCTNPFDPNGRAVLVSGCKGLGVEAGAKFLSEIKKHKAFIKFIKKQKERSFYIILKVSAMYNNIGKPEVIKTGLL